MQFHRTETSMRAQNPAGVELTDTSKTGFRGGHANDCFSSLLADFI